MLDSRAGSVMTDTTSGDVDSTALDNPGETIVARGSLRRNIAQMTTSQIASWLIATVASVIVPRVPGPRRQRRLQLVNSLWAIAAGCLWRSAHPSICNSSFRVSSA